MAWTSKVYSKRGTQVTVKVTAEPGTTEETCLIPWTILSDGEKALLKEIGGRRRLRSNVSVINIIGICGPYTASVGKGNAPQIPTVKISWDALFTAAYDEERLVIAQIPRSVHGNTIGIESSMSDARRTGKKQFSGTHKKIRLRSSSFGKDASSTGRTNILKIELGDSTGAFGADMTLHSSSFMGAVFWITFEIAESAD